MNNRRKLVFSLGAGALVAPFASFAQQPVLKSPRIGVLGLANPVAYAPQVEALRAGLRELGYAEGKNIVLEFRWADGHYDRLPALAAELVRLKVDVLVTHGAGSTAAKNATTTIPIVTYVGDAVSLGLAASLAEPGGNLTGSSFFGPEIGAKRLELIKETVAHAARVGAIINTAGTSVKKALTAMQVTAQHLKLALQMREVRNPEELESAFKEMTRSHVDAIVVMDDPMLVANFKTIAALATKYKLPAIGFTGFAEAGGLMTSGVNLLELWHRHAYFVDKILKGVRPGVIPIEQPTQFELVVNMKTAKALGIKIPQSLLVQATKVIE